MTIQGDHHTNDAENADATVKAVVIVLVVIASMALWYI